jgi:hypothetical protein
VTAPLWLWMLASALWGAGLVALVTHSILRQLRQARTEWFGTEHFYIGQVERLRGDAHSLATWLILARDRIREAEQLFGDQSGAGVDVWKRRIRETVWEVKRADIAERDPQYIDPGRGPAI